MSTGVYKYIQHFYAELQFKNLIDIPVYQCRFDGKQIT